LNPLHLRLVVDEKKKEEEEEEEEEEEGRHRLGFEAGEQRNRETQRLYRIN